VGLELSKLLGSTNGRDKLFRVFQYLMRIVRGSQPKGALLTQRALVVERVLSTSRQTFRLLKWVNVIAKQFTPVVSAAPVVDVLDAAADLCICLFFMFDNLSWLAKATIIKGSGAGFMRRAARFWVAHTVFNVLSQGINIYLIELKRRTLLRSKLSHISLEDEAELRRLRRNQILRGIETIRSSCDTPVSWSLSQYPPNQLSPVLTGSLGVVSSLIGVYQQWPKPA